METKLLSEKLFSITMSILNQIIIEQICNNSNSNSHDNVYAAVIIAVHCHWESSPGSSDECSVQRQVAASRWTNQPEPIDPPIGSYSDYIHHRHLLLHSLKADTQFTIPRTVEG